MISPWGRQVTGRESSAESATLARKVRKAERIDWQLISSAQGIESGARDRMQFGHGLLLLKGERPVHHSTISTPMSLIDTYEIN